jgi:hypothetical protein
MSPSSPPIGSVSSPASRLSTLPAGYPQLTLGEEAASWAHKWLIQPNGPRAGRPFRLTLDQYRFLVWWYAVDTDGQWLFHHGVRRLAKGSGKSPFAAVLALLEFLAPVRLERFDDRLPGGCKGRPVDMPLVQIAATAESQTANTMRMVRAFAPKGSRVVEAYKVDPGKTQYYKLPEGSLEVITSSVTGSEGAEASFIIGDETEHWKPANAGPELAATLEDNLAKSGSRMLETSNSWQPGIECVAEATWEAWLAQEEGRTKGDAGKILYDARFAPPDTDMSDPGSLQAALEWIYGDCDWKRPHVDGEPVEDSKPDVRPIMKRIWSLRARPDDSKRKYLNWPTVSEDAWTTPEAWGRLADPTRLVEPREDVVLFFDGSKSRDATALIGCCVEDGHIFTVDVWEPDPAHDTRSVVPVADVDLAVIRAFERWHVVGFFGDVQEWESFVKVTWPDRYAGQLVVKAVPTGKDPQAVAWDMRGHTYEFTLEAELVEAEINDGTFTHDGDTRLARHVGNMRRRPNRYGVSVGKESPDSPRKIDAGVCMIGARMVRRRVLAAGTKTTGKKPGRVVAWG